MGSHTNPTGYFVARPSATNAETSLRLDHAYFDAGCFNVMEGFGWHFLIMIFWRGFAVSACGISRLANVNFSRQVCRFQC